MAKNKTYILESEVLERFDTTVSKLRTLTKNHVIGKKPQPGFSGRGRRPMVYSVADLELYFKNIGEENEKTMERAALLNRKTRADIELKEQAIQKNKEKIEQKIKDQLQEHINLSLQRLKDVPDALKLTKEQRKAWRIFLFSLADDVENM